MTSYTYTPCVACGDEASGHHGLPVDGNGEIVGRDYGGSWFAQPACARCHAIHAAVADATGKADERNPGATVRAVLAQYDAATRELRRLLSQARHDLRLIGGMVRESLDEIGHEPAETLDDPKPIDVVKLPTPATFPAGTLVRMNGQVYRRMRDSWHEEPQPRPGVPWYDPKTRTWSTPIAAEQLTTKTNRV